VREVGLDEALVIAVDGAHLARPAVGDARGCRSARAFEHLALVVDDRAAARRRTAASPSRASASVRAGQRRDQDAAGLGLPPGVDDRAAALADDVVVPAARPRD